MMKMSCYLLGTCTTAILLLGCANQATNPEPPPKPQTVTSAVAAPAPTSVVSSKPAYQGPAFDVAAVIRGMTATDFECGEAPDVGIWVVTKVEIPYSENVPQNELLLRAALLAKQNISEWLASQNTNTTSLEATKNDSNGKVDVQQNLKVELQNRSEAFLRGVTCFCHEKKNDCFVAWYYATGKNADHSAELEAQLRATPPGVVRVVGIGLIVDGKLAPAKREAKQAALQAAVEQVMGTTVIGQSQLMDNAKAKAKLVSQTVGNIKEYRIVKEGKEGISYIIVLNAKVDKQNILDNYAALVRSMGNPGFTIKSQDPDLRQALGEFFDSLGFKVTENPADTQFVVDANCEYLAIEDEHYGKGIQINVLLKVIDVVSGQQILFARNNPRLTSTFSGTFHQIRQTAAGRAFKTMKKELHEKLNKVVMDWVLNGHEVKVVFSNLPDTRFDEILSGMINNIPCAKFLTRNRDGSTLVLNCSYVGPSADFEEFLRVRLRKDLPSGTALPVTKYVGLNAIEFNF